MRNLLTALLLLAISQHAFALDRTVWSCLNMFNGSVVTIMANNENPLKSKIKWNDTIYDAESLDGKSFLVKLEGGTLAFEIFDEIIIENNSKPVYKARMRLIPDDPESSQIAENKLACSVE